MRRMRRMRRICGKEEAEEGDPLAPAAALASALLRASAAARVARITQPFQGVTRNPVLRIAAIVRPAEHNLARSRKTGDVVAGEPGREAAEHDPAPCLVAFLAVLKCLSVFALLFRQWPGVLLAKSSCSFANHYSGG